MFKYYVSIFLSCQSHGKLFQPFKLKKAPPLYPNLKVLDSIRFFSQSVSLTLYVVLSTYYNHLLEVVVIGHK